MKCYKVASIVSDVLERLLREIAKDGVVRVDDAIRVVRLVANGTYELDIAFAQQEAACFAPSRDCASSRDNAFRRLMVRPFETLLSGEPAPYPRPLLANYFAVLEQAYGDKLDEYERHSKAMLQGLLVAHGSHLDWETFYANPKVLPILIHALRRLLRYLESPTGQVTWNQIMSRTAPTGHRPSLEQVEFIRSALAHTLMGLDPSH